MNHLNDEPSDARALPQAADGQLAAAVAAAAICVAFFSLLFVI